MDELYKKSKMRSLTNGDEIVKMFSNKAMTGISRRKRRSAESRWVV